MWSWEWRCSWSSADRRCSNYIWVLNNFIAYQGATYIRDLTVSSDWPIVALHTGLGIWSSLGSGLCGSKLALEQTWDCQWHIMATSSYVVWVMFDVAWQCGSVELQHGICLLERGGKLRWPQYTQGHTSRQTRHRAVAQKSSRRFDGVVRQGDISYTWLSHDVMTWKYFPHYYPHPLVTSEFPSQRASNIQLSYFICH